MSEDTPEHERDDYDDVRYVMYLGRLCRVFGSGRYFETPDGGFAPMPEVPIERRYRVVRGDS